MTILARLELWKEQGAISTEQQAHLASLSRGEPFSLSLELNLLLYAGVLAFVAGLGWTISTWSQQLGDVLVLTILSIILTASFWYCFSRGPAWSAAETAAADSDLRLCPLPRQPRLVRRTRLPGEPFPRPFRTMGSLSPGHGPPLLLPCLSFRQSLRAVSRFVLTRRMVRAHYLALAVSSGRGIPAICLALLPVGRHRWRDSSAPQIEVAFLYHVSERRCQCSILGNPFRSLRCATTMAYGLPVC